MLTGHPLRSAPASPTQPDFRKPPGQKACLGGFNATLKRTERKLRSKMPKLKTKSGAKKRFKLTATGKLKAGVAGKRHRLISHNAKYIRQNRGTKVMADADAKAIKRFMHG